MKSIMIHFDDAEYKQLIEAKKEMTWREFLMDMIKKEAENGRRKESKRDAGEDDSRHPYD